MSWSLTLPKLTKEEFMGNGLDAVTLEGSQATFEHLEQLEALKVQARMLAASGALGPMDGFTHIGGNVGGHANPEYGQRVGWSGTSTYLSLQTYLEKPVEAVESHEDNA